jgi:hypothetical protein
MTFRGLWSPPGLVFTVDRAKGAPGALPPHFRLAHHMDLCLPSDSWQIANKWRLPLTFGCSAMHRLAAVQDAHLAQPQTANQGCPWYECSHSFEYPQKSGNRQIAIESPWSEPRLLQSVACTIPHRPQSQLTDVGKTRATLAS